VTVRSNYSKYPKYEKYIQVYPPHAIYPVPNPNILVKQLSHMQLEDDEVTICTSSMCKRSDNSTAATSVSCESWDTMQSIKVPTPQAAHKATTSSIKVSKQLAIGDSDRTGQFVMEDALVTNIRPTSNPVNIICPNGTTIRSTHEYNLGSTWLPPEMTDAHIVPGLAHLPLISIKRFCDEGCKVIFDSEEYWVCF